MPDQPSEPTRRHFLIVTASGALLTLTPGCDQKSMRAALFVAIIIGERIVTFSHPALRILKVVLGIAGRLTVVYLTQDKKEETNIFDLSRDEVAKLREAKQVLLEKDNGETVQRVIDLFREADGEEYPPDAPRP